MPPRKFTNPRPRDRHLPPLDKKVVFLDQFVVSEITKVRAGRRDIAHADYWLRLDNEIARCICRQSAIFPECGGHFDESLFAGNTDALESYY